MGSNMATAATPPTEKELHDAYFEILRLASHLDDALGDRSMNGNKNTKARMWQKIDYAVRRLDRLSNTPMFAHLKNRDITITVE